MKRPFPSWLVLGWIWILVIVAAYLHRKKEYDADYKNKMEQKRAHEKYIEEHRDQWNKEVEAAEKRRLDEIRNSPKYKDRPEAFQHYLYLEAKKRDVEEWNRKKWYQKWHW